MAEYFEYLNLPLSKPLFFLLALFVIYPITDLTDLINFHFIHFFNLNSHYLWNFLHLSPFHHFFTSHPHLVLNNYLLYLKF